MFSISPPPDASLPLAANPDTPIFALIAANASAESDPERASNLSDEFWYGSSMRCPFTLMLTDCAIEPVASPRWRGHKTAT
jgi:hypothetical protein